MRPKRIRRTWQTQWLGRTGFGDACVATVPLTWMEYGTALKHRKIERSPHIQCILPTCGGLQGDFFCLGILRNLFHGLALSRWLLIMRILLPFSCRSHGIGSCSFLHSPCVESKHVLSVRSFRALTCNLIFVSASCMLKACNVKHGVGRKGRCDCEGLC